MKVRSSTSTLLLLVLSLTVAVALDPAAVQAQPTPKRKVADPARVPVRRAPVKRAAPVRAPKTRKRPRLVPRPRVAPTKLRRPTPATRPAKTKPARKPGRVFRSKSKRPGVLDRRAGKKVKFDKKKLGAKKGKKPDSDEKKKKVQDVIQWKSNLERGVECKKVPLNTRIRFDASDISLADLTKFISCVTGKNFLISAAAKKGGSITILGPREVTVYEAYKAYLSALRANNLTVVPNGRYLEIVPIADARVMGSPMRRGGSAPNTDQVVTRILRLKHVTAEEISPVIDKFKGKTTDITVYAPTNTIFITAPGREIRRLVKLIRSLDVRVGKDKIWIRKVQYAEAKEIVTILQGLFGKGKTGSTRRNVRRSPGKRRGRTKRTTTAVVGTAGGDLANLHVTKIIPDERTNSIIFVATRANYFQVDRLIRKLDVPIPGEGQIHIHYLENAEAEEIASTLQTLAGGRGGRTSRTSRRSGKKSRKGSKKSRFSSRGGGAAALVSGEV